MYIYIHTYIHTYIHIYIYIYIYIPEAKPVVVLGGDGNVAHACVPHMVRGLRFRVGADGDVAHASVPHTG